MKRILPSALVLFHFLLPIVFSKVSTKQLCDPREYAKAIPDDANKFLQCVNAVAHIGEWAVRQCPPGFVFESTKQRCKSAEAVRRQQSLCQLDPSGIGCPQVAGCSTNMVNPVPGGSCYWPTAKLSPVSGVKSSFLQCIPTTTENQCGMWSQMSCPEGTSFQNDLQICVTVSLPNTCHQMAGSTAYPVCPCNQGFQCPGAAQCTMGVCCLVVVVGPSQPTPPPYPPPMPLPICPNGQPALSLCQSENQCPPGYFCTSGGCCPQSPTPLPQCPNGQIAISTCVGYGQGSCPPQYECINGGCCMMARPLCPNGLQSTQTCTDDFQCPPQHICINNGCCKLSICPSGMAATQFCQGFGPNACPPGMSCINGGCCPLPTCPSGQLASQTCFGSGPAGCPPNQICHNGGCCPLPVCPGGSICAGFCGSGVSCPNGHACVQGGCCPLPVCSSGQPATSTCVLSSDCPAGFQCENGGCCPVPLPICPSGQQASTPCTGPGTCSVGFFCYLSIANQQGCCPIPVCPSGQLALQLCDASAPCPIGYNCINSGCCPLPLPTCPDGQQATSVCSTNQQCAAGFSCMNGGCCKNPIPTCPSGQPAISPCGFNSPCPSGYNCINGGCCPAPRPTCPSGQLAIATCVAGSMCPGGTVCINGACCPAPSVICPNGRRPTQQCDPYGGCPPGFFCLGGYCCEQGVVPTPPPPTVCPTLAMPICFCATINLVCPATSVCNMGYCCASASSSLSVSLTPGAACSSSTQCSGYPHAGHCAHGRCVCPEGTRSNGLGCVTYPANVNAYHSCDQFGTPCSTYFYAKTLRRKAITEEFGITNSTQPLWWETMNSHCVTDRECTLDKICIKETCYKLLKPGEHGCVHTEQCSGIVADTYCAKSKNVNSGGQCRCKKGLYRFENACWGACPQGTKTSGDACVLEENFKSKAVFKDWVNKITLVLYANDTAVGSSQAKRSVRLD